MVIDWEFNGCGMTDSKTNYQIQRGRDAFECFVANRDGPRFKNWTKFAEAISIQDAMNLCTHHQLGK